MISHHPTEATLVAFAAGTLPAPHRIVTRTHLALCPGCQRTARLCMATGGAVLEDLPPASLAPDALQRAMARLGEQDAPRVPRRIPSTVAELATGRWWWIGPGIRLMPLIHRDSDNARLDLIRVAPGTALPGHGHTGSELTCVLQGAFGDATGEYHAGDMVETDAALEHEPAALPVGQDCICLIATTGRLRAHGWLARLVQPLMGI